MFGYHKARRERKKANQEREDFENERKAYDKNEPKRRKKEEKYQSNQATKRTEQAKQERQQARKEGREYAEELLNRDIPGMAPEKRNALQYEANKQIQRANQSANRKLLGEQGQHGISGRSGVAYAQQRDLQRLSNEAQGQSTRDLDKLNEDLKLKKLAAMFNIEQGEATQSQLDRQTAIDELRLEEERKRQKMYEDQINRLFNRI